MPRYSRQLLAAAAATGASPWISAQNLERPSLHVYGTFAGTIQIEGSNEETPTDANAAQVGANITAPGVTELVAVPNHIRVNVSVYTSGAINAYIGAELPG